MFTSVKKRSYSALPFILVLITLLVYFPVIGHQLQTLWDDQWMITNFYTEGGISIENTTTIFGETFEGQYSPINQLMYTFIYYVGGYNPVGFHLYSLLLHLANVVMIYFVLRKALINGRRIDDIYACKIAFFVAFLFAVHPINVEAVAWVSASKVLLYVFFTLLCFIGYLHYVYSRKWIFYIFSCVMFVFSCGSKEQAVILPTSLFLLDILLSRNMKKKGVWLEKLPFILFALLVGLFTLSIQDVSLIAERAGYPLWQRLIFASYSLVEYLVKLIIPVNLMYLYPFPMVIGEDLPLRFYIYPVVLLVAAIGLFVSRKQWIICFGVLFFVFNIALTLHIAPMSRYTLVADRYVYLSSVGIFLIGVWYAVAYIEKQTKKKRAFIYLLVACYFLYVGIYAHQRSKVWYDTDTLKKEIRVLIEERDDIESVEPIE